MYLPDLLWKYRRPITLIVLLCVSSLLMIDSLHRRWVARYTSEAVLGLASPAQKTSESVRDGARNVFVLIPELLKTRARNVALNRRVGELEQQIVLLKEQVLHEQRLIELQDFTKQTEAPKLVARVIGTNPTPWFSAVIIDKGSAHGVERGMPVLSSSGLAGHVVEVYLRSSKVLLLTDSNSRVGVRVQRSRAQGVVQGDDKDGCVLKYVESTADVVEGDVLVTSGSGLIYPEGLLVGRIDELRSRPEALFQWARVAPATDFEKLEEVVILMTPAREARPTMHGRGSNQAGELSAREQTRHRLDETRPSG